MANVWGKAAVEATEVATAVVEDAAANTEETAEEAVEVVRAEAVEAVEVASVEGAAPAGRGTGAAACAAAPVGALSGADADAPAPAPDAPEERGDTFRSRVKKTDVLKFAALIIFLALCCVVVKILWPYIGMLFQDGGVEFLREEIKNAGVAGVFILLGIQLLQIIVAFIPGEVVQVAAGMIYGTWGGFAIVLVGCIISSAIVFLLVRKLGAPFVQEMVSTKYLDKFRAFEQTGKLDIIVFILFLIPGLPKDVFTYLVPLTNMGMKRFLVLATLGRIPAMFMSTFAANGLMQGNYVMSIAIFAAAAVIAVLGIIFREKILAFFGERFSRRKKD